MTISLHPFVITFLLLLFLVPYWIFAYKKTSKFIDNRFAKLEQFLQSPQRRGSFFVGKSLSGYYKGRKINHAIGYSEDWENLHFHIEPREVPHPSKYFRYGWPQPTKNTILREKKIYFVEGLFKSTKDYSEEELKDILEELSLAAEKVESGFLSNNS